LVSGEEEKIKEVQNKKAPLIGCMEIPEL